MKTKQQKRNETLEKLEKEFEEEKRKQVYTAEGINIYPTYRYRMLYTQIRDLKNKIHPDFQV